MYGEIGKLEVDGEQVGGFRSWRIETKIQAHPNKSHTTALANSFWLFEIPAGEIIATFYFSINGKLTIANQSRVYLDLSGEYSLDKLIKLPLKMTFYGNTEL